MKEGTHRYDWSNENAKMSVGVTMERCRIRTTTRVKKKRIHHVREQIRQRAGLRKRKPTMMVAEEQQIRTRERGRFCGYYPTFYTNQPGFCLGIILQTIYSQLYITSFQQLCINFTKQYYVIEGVL